MNKEDFIVIFGMSLLIGILGGVLTTLISSVVIYYEWLLTTDYSQWTVPYRIMHEKTFLGLAQFSPLGLVVGIVVLILVFGIMTYYNERRW